MIFQRSVLGLALLTLILIPLTVCSEAFSATVDPLLLRLQAERLEKEIGAPVFTGLEKIISLENSGDPANPRIGVILRLDGTMPNLDDIPGLVVGSERGTIATARLPLSSLAQLAEVVGIERIDASRLIYPIMDEAVPGGNVDQVWTGSPAYTGQGVLVGVIDSGIDWTHEDFKNNDGTTRIKAIWDQHATGTSPAGFPYGVEFTEAQINSGTVTQRDYSGHGTHVTGIAAGNGRASGGVYKGVAFEADILVAKPYDDTEGTLPEDMIIDAMNYLAQKAEALGQPIAINLSLGGHFGAHDGSSSQEVVIDDLSGQGVVFCIAAGNDGESKRHDSAAANGGNIIFRVPSYTPEAGNNNDFAMIEIWVEGNWDASVSLSLAGTTYGPFSGGYDDYQPGAAGDVHVFNTEINGDRCIEIQIGDMLGNELLEGDWTISFSAGTGTAHAWLTYATMLSDGVHFPNSDNTYSVAVPSTAIQGISVAAWKSKNSWDSIAGLVGYPPSTSWGQAELGDRAPFSAIGPGRVGAEKPDISAPGMAIVSCYSAHTIPAADDAWLLPGSAYFVAQGTSMASPFACGVVALMLQKDPTLTSLEVKTILRGTAITDVYTGTTWNADFGSGKIDAMAAVSSIIGSGIANGDVDLDGSTTVLDVIIMVNHIVAPIENPLLPEASANADVNGDAVVNALDLVRVVAFILGTDTPGKSQRSDDPAVFALGHHYLENGRWWVEATLSGEDVAAGQFALHLPGASWDAGGLLLVDPTAARVAARAVGIDREQIRVLVYDLDNELPPEGLTLQLPFEFNSARSNESSSVPVDAPDIVGLLLADSDGEKRSVVSRNSGPDFSVSLGVSPNPMVGETNIHFRLDRAQPYTLSVYDLRGRLVRVLEQGVGSVQPAVVGWDGCDGNGRNLPSGIYLVRMETGGEVFTNKVVLSR
ncbi:MAG: S8 family serine peptidase [Gemmatimonadales bacterium]|nr:S8 family serine peptidase [Gemmatimonadales bacterium]